MKIYTLKSSIVISVVALAFAACSDSTVESMPDGERTAVSGVSRMRLAVGGGVTVDPAEEKTRGTNLDFQNDTFVPDDPNDPEQKKSIGIFILKAGDYRRWLAVSDLPYSQGGPTDADLPDMGGEDLPDDNIYEDRATLLIADAYRDGHTYGYENIKAYIYPDGSIKRADGLDFIYPLHSSDSVAIFAYAPYKENITYADLKSGFPAAVQQEQAGEAGMLPSDLLFGTPVVGNPLREGEDVAVSLSFCHVMAGVQLNLNIANAPELRSDSIIVSMSNVATADTLLPVLTAEACNNIVPGKGIFLGSSHAAVSSVTMARIGGLTATDGKRVALSCNALVVPQTFAGDRPLTFEITFKGRADGRPDTTVVRADRTQEVTLQSGRKRIYRGYIPTDNTETLPDDGDDDVILGAPKPMKQTFRSLR